MRRQLILFAALLIFGMVSGTLHAADSARPMMNSSVAEAYGNMPLAFVENNGQLNEQVRYVIRGPRASAFFRNDGVTMNVWDAPTSHANGMSGNECKNRLELFSLPQATKTGKTLATDDDLSKSEVRKHAVMKLTFEGSDPDCQVKGIDELPGKVNFLTGQKSSDQHTDISTFKGVVYKNAWSGIDVIYRGDRQQLKYDIRVNPGADLKNIRLKYEGAEKIWLDKAGDLHIQTAIETFVEKIPGIYQEKGGERITVKGGYVLLDAQTVGFRTNKYDPSLSLVIDPESDLIYSTFLGGIGDVYIRSIVVDSSGCAYVAGSADTSIFPTTPGAFDTTFNGGQSDIFVTKLNASGNAIIYSTFLGGSGIDSCKSITVDSSGCAYVAGTTYSTNFPTTSGAFDIVFHGNPSFVTKLNPSGNSLVYSTFLGGSGGCAISSIAVDSSGCAYVTGSTFDLDFPTTPEAFATTSSGRSDIFVTKFNESGSALVYSTFLGGSSTDVAKSIAVDSSGDTYVAGSTSSSDFPTTLGAFDITWNGLYSDAFVTKLNQYGSSLIYSTYLGGSNSDYYCSITVDSEGCAYMAGYTSSSDFPTTPEAFDTTYNGGYSDVFVSKLNQYGSSLIYSTFLGSGSNDYAYSIAVDSSGCAYVAGSTYTSDFPTTTGAFDTIFNGGYYDAFATKLNPSGSDLLYSTFLGGSHENGETANSIAVDSSGCAYVAGETYSTDFPTTAGAFQTAWDGGSWNGFISKLSMGPFITITSPTTSPSFDTTSQALNIAGTASGAKYITWQNDRGGSGTCTGTTTWSATGIPLQPGKNIITVTSTDDEGYDVYAALTVTFTDIEPPRVDITAPTATWEYYTDKSTLNVACQVSDNVGVTGVTWSSSRGGSGTCTYSTSWSANNVALQPGINEITVRATDSAGNIGGSIFTVSYIDNIRPTVRFTVPTTASTYSTTSPIVLLRGTAADNDIVTSVSWSNNRGGSGKCSGTTYWARSIKFLPGVNVITITATDTFGNKGTATLTVNADNTPPTVKVTVPTTTATYATTSQIVLLRGTTSDNGTVESVSWENGRGGSGTCSGTTYWSRSIKFLAGVNVITITAIDALGNKGITTLTVDYTDITPPTVKVTVPTPTATYTTTSEILMLRGTAADNVAVKSVSWANDRGGSGLCSGTTYWARSIKFLPGVNVITLTATDAYGNKGSASIQITR